ncbi:general substrate transporter [Mycena pura]|uniref:General substrate transporter n=1 Tax=Mycena pura TaxID=153505 RepID=A0AAD6VJT8_9AGAR|nr:general substrate transporter [Mycena pura]
MATPSVPEPQLDSEVFSPTSKNAPKSRESQPRAAARLVSAQTLRPTSRAALKLYLVLVVPSMASICVGYDISVMNYINGMEQYLSYFGLQGQGSGGGVGSTTGLIFAMPHPTAFQYTIGTCIAVLFAGPVADRFGRRGAMFAGGLFCVVGGTIVTVAKNVEYLKGGRLLLGISTALLQVGAPMYVVEISPPQWRGRMSGMYAGKSPLPLCLYPIAILATICSGIVTTFTGRWNTSASWRVPFSIQIIPAAGVFFFSYFIPESPRWLMSVGRKEEAGQILSRYHGNGDANAPLVVLELSEFEDSIKVDASRKHWWDYASLFKTRSDRYRSSLVLFLAFCGQWGGSGLSYFLVVLLANDHISTENLRLILSLINNIVGAIGALCGALLSDKVGRRSIWFWGTVCCTISLIISGVCTATSGLGVRNHAQSNAAIAFLLLFNFFFCATYVPLPAAYVSECMTFDNRYTFVASTASLVNTYATPIALANIQWKLYFVFIAWDVFACVLIWIFAVETSGKTLSFTASEELNSIFEVSFPLYLSASDNSCQEAHPVKASLRKLWTAPLTVLNLSDVKN